MKPGQHVRVINKELLAIPGTADPFTAPEEPELLPDTGKILLVDIDPDGRCVVELKGGLNLPCLPDDLEPV
jgi:hypothetical protein